MVVVVSVIPSIFATEPYQQQPGEIEWFWFLSWFLLPFWLIEALPGLILYLFTGLKDFGKVGKTVGLKEFGESGVILFLVLYLIYATVFYTLLGIAIAKMIESLKATNKGAKPIS